MTVQDQTGAVALRLNDPLVDCQGRDDGVGFVGPDVPIEVLLASGRPFGHLPWRAAGRTEFADLWLESGFPFWARSIVERWHEGEFDQLDRVVFSRADDVSQRLYYYIAELQRRGKLGGPKLAMFDIALIPRETSEIHTEQAIEDLMRLLNVSTERLFTGIARANELRQQFADIEAERVADGPFYERLARAALWTDAGRWLRHWPGQRQVSQAGVSRRRVLLAGSMPPDGRLHEVVESAGASIIAEAHPLSMGRNNQVFEIRNERPERAVARNLLRASVAPRAFLDRAAWLVARTAHVRASAVILWLTREDEALVWSVPAQQRALAAAGVPFLLLTAANWRADDDTLVRIAGFCREGLHASA